MSLRPLGRALDGVRVVDLTRLLPGPFSFVLWVILMWKAFEGERFKLPVGGEWAAEQAEGHA